MLPTKTVASVAHDLSKLSKSVMANQMVRQENAAHAVTMATVHAAVSALAVTTTTVHAVASVRAAMVTVHAVTTTTAHAVTTTLAWVATNTFTAPSTPIWWCATKSPLWARRTSALSFMAAATAGSVVRNNFS